MNGILGELSEEARRRVERAKADVPLEQLKRRCSAIPSDGFPFEDALRKDGMSFICEVKRASPSKGVISESFPTWTLRRITSAPEPHASRCSPSPAGSSGT